MLTTREAKNRRVFLDLDHGIEWCEGEILSQMAGPELTSGPVTLSRSRIALDGLLRSSLRGQLVQKIVTEGEVLIQQGDPTRGLYFIDYGLLTAYPEMPDGEPLRLRTMGPGNIVGEMGMYLNLPASATVKATDACLLYFLPGEKLREVDKDDPQTAAELHRFMVRLVSERLQNANATLRALSQ